MNQLPATTTGEQNQLIETAHREHFQVVREFIALLVPVGVALALLSGILAAAVSAAAPIWLTLPIAVGFGMAAIIAVATVRALVKAREILKAIADEWQAWQEAAREIETIRVQNITAVSVKGRSNVVSVNSNGSAVENVRLIPLNTTTPMRFIDGVAECDLIYFVDRLILQGWSKRAWLGTQLPSGKLVSTYEDYNQLIAPVLKAKVIVDRGERSAGKLALTDVGEIKAQLGLPTGAQNSPETPSVPVPPAT